MVCFALLDVCFVFREKWYVVFGVVVCGLVCGLRFVVFGLVWFSLV